MIYAGRFSYAILSPDIANPAFAVSAAPALCQDLRLVAAGSGRSAAAVSAARPATAAAFSAPLARPLAAC